MSVIDTECMSGEKPLYPSSDHSSYLACPHILLLCVGTIQTKGSVTDPVPKETFDPVASWGQTVLARVFYAYTKMESQGTLS